MMRRIMVHMTAVSTEVLGRVLTQRGVEISPDEFLSILAEAVDSTDTLTGAERDFLIQHGSVSPDAFDPTRLTQARQRIAQDAAKADAEAAQGHTTSEVAQMLGTAAANVRRGIARGDLFAAGTGRNREHVLPAWQFHHGRALPHLRDIITALPEDMHPLDVQTFMTTPRESLGERTPAEWLASGGAPEPVTRLADDLNRV